MTHALTLAGMVAAIAAGHYALAGLNIADWRTWKIGTRAALAVLFVAATGYIVVSSGARTAEQAAIKVVDASDIAEKRARAKKRLDDAEDAHTASVTYWTTQRDKADAECAPERGGEGTKCRGARSSESAALSVTQLRRTDVNEARAALDKVKPAPPPHAGYAHFAKIVAIFTGLDIEATTARIEEQGVVSTQGMAHIAILASDDTN